MNPAITGLDLKRALPLIALILAVLLPAAARPSSAEGSASAGSSSPAGSFSPATIAMITWRGETEAEKGFVEGLASYQPPVTLIRQHADQDLARLEAIVAGIQKAPVDLIYVFGTIATQTVLQAIKDTPVVFNIVNRPVAAGIIQSWQRSGNNATGASNQVPVESQLKALKKVVKFRRLGIIYNPREPNSRIQREIAARLQVPMGFRLIDYQIAHAADLKRVMPSLKDAVDAVFVPADSLMISLGEALAHWINRLKLPSLATVESLVVDHGLLLGLQPSYYQLGRLAADKARRILSGTAATDIPSSRLDYFQMTVNMQTARMIDIQIPISILVMANKIIR
jgi:putative tryptophan/tyrosine transport system substrate-binding protein